MNDAEQYPSDHIGTFRTLNDWSLYGIVAIAMRNWEIEKSSKLITYGVLKLIATSMTIIVIEVAMSFKTPKVIKFGW